MTTVNPTGYELAPIRVSRKKFVSIHDHKGVDRLVLRQAGAIISLPTADTAKLIAAILEEN